mgnify:CR=1 FL=1
MNEICPECGVPQYISTQHLWLNNGDIVNAAQSTERLNFLESEFMDPLIREIEKLVGVPIEPIVIITFQEATRVYVESLLPEGIKEMVHNGSLDPRTVADGIAAVGKLAGYGAYGYVDMRMEGGEMEFCTYRVTKPFSVPMGVACHGADFEAILGVDQKVRYEQKSPDTYEVTCYPSPHPEELKRRLAPRQYQHRDGDLELERCATCNVPKLLSEFQWVLEEGLVVNKATGRRMAITGPNQTEPIFQELEEELGEEIPRTVIKAQRVIAKSGFLPVEILENEEVLRMQLALRGLGNLRSLRVDEKGLAMCLENACLPLVVVGSIQGLYDLRYGVDSGLEWEITPDRELNIELIG